MAKRVAVIGAGSSGLTSIKCCLDEGLEPVCFESGDDIGGLWKLKEQPEADRCSIYRSVIVNTSKEMMCYSDFPMPDHYPNFIHNSMMMQYFRLYAEHFNLLKHIRFQVIKHHDITSAEISPHRKYFGIYILIGPGKPIQSDIRVRGWDY